MKDARVLGLVALSRNADEVAARLDPLSNSVSGLPAVPPVAEHRRRSEENGQADQVQEVPPHAPTVYTPVRWLSSPMSPTCCARSRSETVALVAAF